MFKLDSRLQNDGPRIEDLFDGFVVVQKQGVQYPWLVVIPMVADASELFDLSGPQRDRLFEVVAQLAAAMKQVTGATKMNVECIGNVCSQLHVHLIARHDTDETWPAPVWSAPFQPRESVLPKDFEANLRRVLADAGV